MRRTLFLIALLVLSTLAAVAPTADARPETPASCTDAVNDAGTCPGALCVWPTPKSTGVCTKPSPAKVCTADHDTCGWSDVVCVSAGKAHECVSFVCACMPLQVDSLPTSPECANCVPVPWVCVETVNAAQCWGADGRHDICMGYSLEVPFCTDIPCQDCYTINCTTLRPACDPTHPCSWAWLQCVPCECPPMAWSIDVPATPVPVGGSCTNCLPVALCVNAQHEATKCGGHDVCVYGYNWKPVCRDVPCGDASCVSIPSPCDGKLLQCTCDPSICDPHLTGPDCANCIPPLVGVCWDQTGQHGCYGHHDICIGFSYEIPFCTDLPTTTVCGSCLPQTCALKDPCESDMVCASYRGVSECVDVPMPCDGEYTECTCDICDGFHGAPTAPSSGPEPNCMYYYYEMDLGAIRYVQRDSCHSELYVNGERVK